MAETIKTPPLRAEKLPRDHRLVAMAERAWQPWMTIDVVVYSGISNFVVFKCIDGVLLHCPGTVEHAEAVLRAMLGQTPPWVKKLADEWEFRARRYEGNVVAPTLKDCAQELLDAAKGGAL